jgi:predicted secreted protein
MATTGVFNGTSLVVLIGGEVIAYSTSCSLSIAIDTPDASNKESLGWAEEIGGQRSWSLTTDGLATVSPTTVVATYVSLPELTTLAIARTAVTVMFTTVTAGTATPIVDDAKWTGQAFIESVDMTADMENPVTYSVSFKGTGILTQSKN